MLPLLNMMLLWTVHVLSSLSSTTSLQGSLQMQGARHFFQNALFFMISKGCKYAYS